MQVPLDGDIHMLETLDLAARTSHLRINVDWFRAIHHYDVPNHAWHEHRNVEMHFVMSGSVTFSVPGKTLDVIGGQAIIIPPNMPHRLQNSSGQMYYRYVLKFSIECEDDEPEALFMAQALDVQDVRIIPIYGRVMELLEDCMHEAVERINGFTTIIEVNLIGILTAVARELTHSSKVSYAVREKINTDQQRMQHIMSILESDDMTAINIEELAQKVFLSSRQMQRIVQRQYGMTMRELIMKLRLKRAKELLKNPDMPINEIAQQTGFASQQSFSRFFRKMEGEPPASYRNSALARRMKPIPNMVEKIDDKELLR